MSEPATAFDLGISVRRVAEGSWSGEAQAGWSAPPGPNGGYLAAIILQAMTAQVADPARPVRSITLHYLRAPQVGPLSIEVSVERAGRTLSTLSARLLQDDRLRILALAAFGGDFEPADSFAAQMPAVQAADQAAAWPEHPRLPPIAQRLEFRGVIGGAPFSGGSEALTGGWMRLREPRPLDAPGLTLFADAWLPAAFVRQRAPVMMPTIDLTVHFRDPAATAALAADDPVLGVFRSTHAAGGYVEEDGELWSPDGALLAQCRQLALVRPMPA